MPIYEFKCLKCEEDFETLVFRSDDNVTCPHCDSNKLERLMSACGHKTGGGSGESYAPPSGASSGCASCGGGDCSSCH